MAGSFDLLFSWKMMRAWKGEKKMKKIVPSAAAALVFVLITLLYYRIAAAMSNRFFQSELSTDMWVAIGFLFLYLIVILPLSIAAFTKIRAALTRRLDRPAAYLR